MQVCEEERKKVETGKGNEAKIKYAGWKQGDPMGRFFDKLGDCRYLGQFIGCYKRSKHFWATFSTVKVMY
jgi:hypothetical protein